MSYYWLILFAFGSYLLGSVNFGVIISKRLFNRDIRATGSGNPGATNVLRHFGRKWAYLVFFLDASKGAVAALTGLFWYGGFHYSFNPLTPVSTDAGVIAMYVCGFFAIIGHCFPIFLKFKGGKGVSTMVGMFIVVNPAIAAVAFAVDLFVGSMVEYASLASFIYVTFMTLMEGYLRGYSSSVCIILAAIYFFIIIMHHKNIFRLLSGTENHATLKKKKVVKDAVPINPIVKQKSKKM